MALVIACYLPTAILRYVGSRSDVQAARVSPKDANGAFFRDLAATLRASQPEGEITLLSSPNASTGIGYYGRFKTLGTLYWENAAGLKSAARIFSAQTEQEAARLITQHKVTHVAMVFEENFIAQYYDLLHPGAKPEEIKKCFGWRLLADKVVPQWLQMIPYKVPDELAPLNASVMLFKVNFAQTLPDAIYNVALAQIALEGFDDAEKSLDLLLKQYPQLPQPWLRKAEILVRRHNWAEAAGLFLKGIALAPEGERADLYNTTGGIFYNQGQHAIAAQIYRRALGDRPTADAACYLAWVLATSADDSVRKPAEALKLAEEALKVDPNSPTFLNTMAAALAENGRLPEAVAVADRAVANARLQGRADAVKTSEQNLAVLRSGKPIRK
jgi:tetratricopeptide (TPR) repeat protein